MGLKNSVKKVKKTEGGFRPGRAASITNPPSVRFNEINSNKVEIEDDRDRSVQPTSRAKESEKKESTI